MGVDGGWDEHVPPGRRAVRRTAIVVRGCPVAEVRQPFRQGCLLSTRWRYIKEGTQSLWPRAHSRLLRPRFKEERRMTEGQRGRRPGESAASRGRPAGALEESAAAELALEREKLALERDRLGVRSANGCRGAGPFAVRSRPEPSAQALAASPSSSPLVAAVPAWRAYCSGVGSNGTPVRSSWPRTPRRGAQDVERRQGRRSDVLLLVK